MLIASLAGAGQSVPEDAVVDMPIYLELGASSSTMISLISLGLSRTTASILSGMAPSSGWSREEGSMSDALDPLGIARKQEPGASDARLASEVRCPKAERQYLRTQQRSLLCGAGMAQLTTWYTRALAQRLLPYCSRGGMGFASGTPVTCRESMPKAR